MNQTLFESVMWLIAGGFTVFFCAVVVPPLIADPDIFGAFAAGFVNPYSTGYSVDVILCWFILLGLIVHDAGKTYVPYRWVCLCLGVVPGVAVGLSLYLISRSRHYA